MLIFAIDTATLQGSFGWITVEGNDPAAPITGYAALKAPAIPGHAETVLDRMKHVLACGGHTLQDVDLFVFGRGPGTFTGVRIGLSTVKGIALACEKPIIGVSSLEALALSTDRPGRTAALIDAKRKELFAALYDVTVNADGRAMATPILEEWVGPASEVLHRIADTAAASVIQVTGNGIPPYRDRIEETLNAAFTPDTAWTPCPVQTARIGFTRFVFKGPDDLDAVEPVYIREPDARLPAVKLR